MDRRALLPPGPGGELTEAEQRLVACAASGEWWQPELPEGVSRDPDPAKAAEWPPECELRADVIRCLLTGVPWMKGQDPWPVHAKGLQITGTRIGGNLDLEGCDLIAQFWLTSSAVMGNIVLMDARTNALSFQTSHVRALNAARAHIDGDLYLRNEFHATEEVNLSSAEIGGHLDCSNGTFENEGGTALDCDSLKVGYSVFLRNKFHAKGEVILRCAEIGGQFDCSSGTFENERGTALECDSLKVGRSVILRDKFHAIGEVVFRSAEISGQIDCSNGTFENKGKTALNCGSLKVGLDMFLRYDFHAEGEVDLRGAEIGDHLDCSGGTFENEGGTALQCDALTVGSSVYLRNGFNAKGEVNFIRAVIGGNLRNSGGTFENENALALDLSLSKIGASLSLNKVASFKGDLDLRHAETVTFTDDKDSWPQPGRIWLDGFSYERFAESRTDWKTRLAWLKRQPADHLDKEFRPQPWAQLIKVLREMGHEYDAKCVAVERANMIARNETRFWVRAWYGFLRITVGYGYRPVLPLLWSLVFIFVGWIVFGSAAANGFMAARNERPAEFASFVYALDAYVPAIALGQQSEWQPSIAQAYSVQPNDYVLDGAAGLGLPISLSDGFFRAGGHRILLWLERILGWIFVPLFIAGLSGIMKKE